MILKINTSAKDNLISINSNRFEFGIPRSKRSCFEFGYDVSHINRFHRLKRVYDS